MKKILIFSIISVISLLGVSVKAYTITSEDTPYYFTFTNNSGKTFSDNLKIYYVDRRVSYCIESGAKLGDGSDYTIGTDRNINSVKRDFILYYMYYGYKFYGHDDIKYYLATQALIWNELLSNPGVTYSTELFKNGEIIDLTYYINEIKNTVKIFREGPYKSSLDTIYMGEELYFPLDNDIMEYFTVHNISGNMSYRFIGTTLNVYNTRKNGSYNINTKENDK
ncbi:MAG: Cys-Gln thioester bond-forming surface protein [Bacilli bacterium]|nr:Cys-Gln thioester bond-forming surface protein [Bacilli bacterium]